MKSFTGLSCELIRNYDLWFTNKIRYKPLVWIEKKLPTFVCYVTYEYELEFITRLLFTLYTLGRRTWNRCHIEYVSSRTKKVQIVFPRLRGIDMWRSVCRFICFSLFSLLFHMREHVLMPSRQIVTVSGPDGSLKHVHTCDDIRNTTTNSKKNKIFSLFQRWSSITLIQI